MRPALTALLLLLAAPAAAQEWITVPPSRPQAPAPEGGTQAAPANARPGVVEAVSAPRGTVRVLDKIDGTVTDLDLATGETGEVGLLTVTLGECRAPVANPAGDAYALVSIRTRSDETALFEGWLIASAPALNAMDHPRYDVWALRCGGV
jgi:hypothetical protein